jgi:hypothetical protein
MQHDMHRADFREDQPVALKPYPIAVLRESDRVVATLALEAREPDLFRAFTYTAEECFECEIDTFGDILKHLRVNGFERGARILPFGQQALSFVPVRGALLLFVSALAIGQRLVIHPAAFLKLLLKDTPLAFGEIDAIFEGFAHPFSIAPHCLSSKHVLCQTGLKPLKQVKPLYPRG